MVITKRLKLYPPNKEKERLLFEMAKTQSACVNFWIDKIREIQSTNIKELQKRFYYEAKEKFGLRAKMTQLAKFTAIRMVRASKRKRINAPYLKKEFIKVMNLKIDKNNLGISFGQGYFWIPFHSQQSPEGIIRESTIKNINGTWYCFLSIEVKEPKPKKYKRYLGVDLGIAKIAVVSDEKGKHNKFFRGEQLRAKRNHYLRLRQRLQPKIKQGNVYKLLKRISKKEANWMRDMNHKISREIVNMALKLKKNIAIENLTGIIGRIKTNKKTRRMLHSWAFRQLADFIRYKARLAGLEVSSVDPRETSRMCPKCGNVSRSNRKSQNRFRCNKCGYESNADRVAAINIARRVTELSASPMVYGQQATALM